MGKRISLKEMVKRLVELWMKIQITQIILLKKFGTVSDFATGAVGGGNVIGTAEKVEQASNIIGAVATVETVLNLSNNGSNTQTGSQENPNSNESHNNTTDSSSQEQNEDKEHLCC